MNESAIAAAVRRAVESVPDSHGVRVEFDRIPTIAEVEFSRKKESK